MPGLLQKFEVSSDTPEQLRHALAITLMWNCRGASHYLAGNEEGFDWIELRWTDTENATPLPFRLDTEEKLFSFVRDWLDSADRGEQYDTDGSVSEGWLVTRGCFYAVCRVQADWIIYGK